MVQQLDSNPHVAGVSSSLVEVEVWVVVTFLGESLENLVPPKNKIV